MAKFLILYFDEPYKLPDVLCGVRRPHVSRSLPARRGGSSRSKGFSGTAWWEGQEDLPTFEVILCLV